ncbi:AmmeMemoRadiSam system protein B [bacterium]|nr:AmmeMemoRadiSam system protein B [bacterium]
MRYFKSIIPGVFYPSKKEDLENIIDSLFKEMETKDFFINNRILLENLESINDNSIGNLKIKAIIVPHAGYIYSGKGAAITYSKLKNIYKKVVLIGDSHYVAFNGVTTYQYDGIETPLGKIDFIKPTFKTEIIDNAFYKEHTLDVQIPFLQKRLTDFKIIPILIGDENHNDIINSLIELSKDSETLFVISTDLSHFLDYNRATVSDFNVAKKISNLDFNSLKREELCGFNSVKIVLNIAKNSKWICKNISLFNSGDITNDKSRVVGYGSWIFYGEEND